MTLAELYQAFGTDGAKGETARQLLAQTHWFTVNAEFDPRTGNALPQPLSRFLTKVSLYEEPRPGVRIQDRLYRITEHARTAVERLFRALNESPRREHALLPVRAVRELDAGSFVKLSMRPGRNIIEKLAGNPYLQGVRRFQSVDLLENRLLKAFVLRLAELLTLRADALGEPEDELIARIESWLLSNEGKAIGNWDNSPPNNALLAHRDYRRVWDSWRRLQSLDDDIGRDLSRLAIRDETTMRWRNYGRMYGEGTHVFADMPVLFDYDEFTIRTWNSSPVFREVSPRIGRFIEKRSITSAVCLDLAEIRPRFANTPQDSQTVPETYLWQRWRNDSDTVDIALFNSDAAYLHPDAASVASSDLFFAGDSIPEHLLDRAARVFADRLHETFRNEKLIWLVPDALNDFDLEIVRRNLNARFPRAEPLPRSVAALFEKVDYTCITKDGYSVVVVDTIGNITCVIKLIARFDPDLIRHLPETRGYYWERCPPVLLSPRQPWAERRYDMVTVDVNGAWHNSVPPKPSQGIDRNVLKDETRIGQFALCLNLSSSPVVGGIRLHSLQTRAGDIPLWRDKIPELSIKVMKDGRPHRFYLVSRGTTVKPVRGLSVQIPIKERFTLPAGRRFYQFPLFQGENAAELRFYARLDSPAFPLKSNTECELILTFKYGDDEPYTLMFVPLDNSFLPVRATWQRKVEENVTDAPAPDYPAPCSWDDLRRMPKPDSHETSDLLKWTISALEWLDCELFIRPDKRTVGEIIHPWRTDKNRKRYTFARCRGCDANVFIHEDHFASGFCFEAFGCGDSISFELHEQDGKFSGRKVASSDCLKTRRLWHIDEARANIIAKEIRKRLYFPIIQIWRDGRSITDKDCPPKFAKAAEEKIAYLAQLARMSDIHPLVRNEVLFLLASLHRDAPDECVEWLTEQVEADKVCDPRAVGFALGDVSQKWQQYIFDRLTTSPRRDAVSVFAYAIWRERQLVERFSLSELKVLLNALSERLDCIRSLEVRNHKARGKWVKPNVARATSEPLELLLGLLRTRASNNPDIRMLLQPHQNLTKQFAEQVDCIEEILIQANIELFSRLQIKIQKPEGVQTPDLLYALRLYLTGDDGANAIHITEITDASHKEGR